MRRVGPAVALLTALSAIAMAACTPAESPTGGARASTLTLLAPAAGSVLRQPRIEVAVLAPESEASDLAGLQVSCSGRDLTPHFEPLKRRMRTLGGGFITTVTLDLGELGLTGGLRFEARLAGAPSDVAISEVTYEPHAGRLSVRVLENGGTGPARLVLSGLSGTPDPDFSTPGMERVDARPAAAPRPIIDSPTGQETLVLAPGRYRVLAGRGLEFTAAAAEVEVTPNRAAALDLALTRVIETPGWISADLHVHASPSMDSFLPMRDRVVTFLAAGVEVLVGTDHNMLADYAPAIATVPGASTRIASLIGVETELRPARGGEVGHWSLLPFASVTGRPVRPWPMPQVREPAEIYRLFRDGGPETPPPAEPRAVGLPDGVIQVNHPRGLITEPGGDVRGTRAAAWFTDSGFDPAAPLPEADAPPHPTNGFLARRDASGEYANADFDAIEILNRFSPALYREVRGDWFALLQAGWRRTGTANSDTHHRVMVGAGFPRNFVAVPDDRPAALDSAAFCRAVREGAVVGTTGPFIRLLVNDVGPGGTTTAPRGRVRVVLRVEAAPWVPVREVRLVVGGEVHTTWAARDLDRGVVRLGRALEIPLRDDTWILAEAGQPLDAPETPEEGIYGSLAPGFAPIAFTNPVYVDRSGNGWRPGR